MRKLLLLCCALSCGLLYAQNWALINPDYKYNYSNDGTDTISNQIFVTHVDTLGVDSFRYELNTIALLSDTGGAGLISSCADPGSPKLVRTGQPQNLGWSVLHQNGIWMIEGWDTLTVQPFGALGSNWSGPANISASLFQAASALIMGSTDSVKWIAYTNGDTIALSKAHGIVYHGSASGVQHGLIGIQGAIITGEAFPTQLDLFNYQSGDILQYHNTMDWSDGICHSVSDGHEKYTFLSRMDQSDSTAYSVRHVYHAVVNRTSIFGGTGCTSYQYNVVDTLELIILHDHWTSDNFLGTVALSRIWPDAASEDENEGLLTVLGADRDAQGRHVLSTRILNSDIQNHTACQTLSDTNMFKPNSEYTSELYSTYTTSIGLVELHYFLFEHSGSRTLEGSFINGVEVGTIIPDDILLGVENRTSMDRILLAPNPADDHLLLTSVAPGATCTILNMTGQVLLTHTTSSSAERIDVSGLVPGFYVLNIAGIGPLRFVIAR